jgi:hypothetical protein
MEKPDACDAWTNLSFSRNCVIFAVICINLEKTKFRIFAKMKKGIFVVPTPLLPKDIPTPAYIYPLVKKNPTARNLDGVVIAAILS